VSEAGIDRSRSNAAPAATPDDRDDVPLFVDMDGVLIHTDITVEALFALIRARPASILLILGWLRRGIAHLKRQVAARTDLDVGALPYNARFLDFLRQEKAQGRRLVLATAADRALGQKVADHLGLFSAVLASDGERDLTGARKLVAIRKATDGPFDYAGNHLEDLNVFRAARQAIVVDPEPALRRAVRRQAAGALVLDDGRQTVGAYLEALRPRAWAMSLLVLTPALLGALAAAPDVLPWGRLAIAVAAFSLCGSAMAGFDTLLHLAERRARAMVDSDWADPVCDGRVSVDRMAALVGLLGGVGLLAGTIVAWQLGAALLAYCLLHGACSVRSPARGAPRVAAAAALAGLRVAGGSVLVTGLALPLILGALLFGCLVGAAVEILRRGRGGLI
jgi:phosphoserine phosphatase